jgi:hypothetical protein
VAAAAVAVKTVEAVKTLIIVTVVAKLTAACMAAVLVKVVIAVLLADTNCIEAVVAVFALSGALDARFPQLAQEICDDGQCTI